MSALLWSPEALGQALGASPTQPMRDAVCGVSIDTRSLAAGDIFFAIRGQANDGQANDGHDYVERAFANGAAAAIVERAQAGQGPQFIVDDSLRALERLGVAGRRRARANIVAVTGSVGKTSAKEMLRVALSKSGRTHASAASYNNHLGVPLTLARMPADAAFGVFEIGMNHAGEITPLVAMVRPAVALTTTIAPVHIEYLGSLENIARAKAEIYSGLAPGGVAIINADAPHADLLAQIAADHGARVQRFGASSVADAQLLDYGPQGEGGLVKARINGAEISFALGAPGLHQAQNALGVLLAALALGADFQQSAAALADFTAPTGRGQKFPLPTRDGDIIVIDESYNANPASMRAALALLGASAPASGGRRIAVIGDMLELGAEGPAMHEALAQDLAAQNIDLLFGAGPLTRSLYDAAPARLRGHWAANAGELQVALIGALRAGDIVMIKGSNGSRMGPVVAALKAHFSRLPASG